MAIIMRFLDCDGFDRERFFEVVNVKETNASTLKKEKVYSIQRPGATRRSSHFTSVNRLISMFDVVHEYLEKMICNGSNNDIRGEAKGVYDTMSTFKLVFILHLMNKVLNAIYLISATKLLLQSLRESGWDTFIKSVISFCESYHIDVLGINNRYMKDFQLMELNNRFIYQTIELLTLSSALNPVDSFKSFNVDDICNLAEKFYPRDFTQFEILTSKRQLELHFLHFQNYINRLTRLVLTLPVSTTMTERAFSAMKFIKTPLRNNIEKKFLSNCMIIYIEREFVDTINSDSIMEFSLNFIFLVGIIFGLGKQI
ncbi:hypothetical protein CISIN_1g046388mg [Citrus sinensis]|uniref:HAT C-terminal dimerisation domain-containing protein n=1 Tax=Citrus sinensis TaxID=2711 RepID=A0A067F789_CITSI|nr:hypothetical protein CISIN_1g046388mg [Citrus sinensis]